MKRKQVRASSKKRAGVRGARKKTSKKTQARSRSVRSVSKQRHTIRQAMRHDSHKRYQHKRGVYCFECEHHPDDAKEMLEEECKNAHL